MSKNIRHLDSSPINHLFAKSVGRYLEFFFWLVKEVEILSTTVVKLFLNFDVTLNSEARYNNANSHLKKVFRN